MIHRTVIALLMCFWIPLVAQEVAQEVAPAAEAVALVNSVMNWGFTEIKLIKMVEAWPSEASKSINGSLNLRGQTLAMVVAQRGFANLLKVLVERGADLTKNDKRGNSVLSHAVRSSAHRAEMVAFLLPRLPAMPDDINHAGWSPLAIALVRDDEGVSRALRAAGAKPPSFDTREFRNLLDALRAGRLADAQAAVERGASVNQLDEDGHPLLLHVVVAGKRESVVWLLDHKADPNTENPEGMTPLTLSARSADCLPILEILLDRGGDPSRANKDGETPLMEAVLGNRLDSVRVLLARGAKVDAESNDGSTALFSSLFPDRLPIVRALLAAGANPHKPNRFGESALDRVRKEGRTEVEAVLEHR
jgi:ankyrin repeat protein